MRTDLASEQLSLCTDCTGVNCTESNFGNVKIERVEILKESDGKLLKKPTGRYVTVNFGEITPEDTDGFLHSALKAELSRLLPKSGNVLVAGLGNRQITPDALGPKVADRVLATRHVSEIFSKNLGLGKVRSVSVISAGVLGQTGIESAEIIEATAKKTNAVAVVVIDALAAHSVSRLLKSVQITDSGICPGSGVGNARCEISRKTLGVPTVAVGVPTVVDLGDVLEDTGTDFKTEKNLMVTPRDIDSMVDLTAHVLSHALNCALQPTVPPEILLALA